MVLPLLLLLMLYYASFLMTDSWDVLILILIQKRETKAKKRWTWELILKTVAHVSGFRPSLYWTTIPRRNTPPSGVPIFVDWSLASLVGSSCAATTWTRWIKANWFDLNRHFLTGPESQIAPKNNDRINQLLNQLVAINEKIVPLTKLLLCFLVLSSSACTWSIFDTKQ